MLTRDYIQENRYDMGTSGTLTFNLDYSDPISEISLLFEATNDTAGNKSNPPEMSISKIEIVDGGEVLWDAVGVKAFALWCTLNGGLPHCYRTGATGDAKWTPINLLFGRYLYDREFAFNPLAHKNPQLKITFDEATINTPGTDGYATDTWNLSIVVKLMEESAPPIGFLSAREIEAFSSASSGDRRVELPTDRPIRLLTTRVYESGTHMENHITTYKLQADGGKRVFFNLLYRNMRDKCSEYFKPILVPNYTICDDAEWHQSWVGDGFVAFIRAHTGTRIAAATSHSGGRFRVELATHGGVAVNNDTVHYGVRGFPLHNMFIYPFGRLDNPEDWLNATLYNKLDYILTQNNELGTIQVGVQQLYPY